MELAWRDAGVWNIEVVETGEHPFLADRARVGAWGLPAMAFTRDDTSS